MEYIVIIVVVLYVLYKLKLFKPTKSTSRNSVKKTDSEIMVYDRQQNTDGLLVKIRVDVFYDLYCQFFKDGSPWVNVQETENNLAGRYNVKTSRWKNGDCPVMPDYQRKLTKVLKAEWEAAWESFGSPEYQSGRKKPAPAPSSVGYSKQELRLTYGPDNLSSLPKQLVIEGSSGSSYTVNLPELSCSCPDFSKRRQNYPANDIRRMCKHQVRALIDTKKNTKVTPNEMIQKVVRGASSSGRGIPLFSNFYEIKITENIRGPKLFHVMLPDGDFPWAEVIFFAKRSYERSGYNVFEKRWGRHTNPFPSGSRRAYNLIMDQITSR